MRNSSVSGTVDSVAQTVVNNFESGERRSGDLETATGARVACSVSVSPPASLSHLRSILYTFALLGTCDVKVRSRLLGGRPLI